MKNKFDIGFLLRFSMDDFKNKYAGSLLGVMWAFLQPIATIVIYWFIFQVGFKNDAVGGVPFILWLMSGIVPWFFINEAIVNGTSALVDYSYLVKKVVFNIDILPLVKVISTFVIQVILLIFTFGWYIMYGFKPTLHWLQLLYYIIYAMVICAGVSYFTSALYVFFKDIIQLVAIATQVIFWLTPIVWRIDIMPEKIQTVLRYNPIYYVIYGYRDAFIYKGWFFHQRIGDVVYYWTIAFVILFIGLFTFYKLKQHFADVL